MFGKTKRKMRSFALKISIAFSIIVAVSFSLYGLVLYKYVSDILWSQIIQDQQKSLEQVADHVLYVQDAVKMVAQTIAVDNEIQSSVREENDGTIFQKLVRKQDMRRHLASYVMLQPYCIDIQIITENGGGFSSNNTETALADKDMSWYTEWKLKGETAGYTKMHGYYREQGQGEYEVITYITAFRDLDNIQNVLGYIAVHINAGEIFQTTWHSDLLENITLYNGDGEIVAGNVLSEKSTQIFSHEAKDYVAQNGNVILSSLDLQNRWMLATEISSIAIRQKMRPILEILILFVVLLAAGICFFLYIFVRRYIKPIGILENAAKEISRGNFDIHLQIQSNDEFKLLGDTFNEMAFRIKELLQISIDHEKKEKENEINRLMLQINPHFIYNTLNSIVYMAKLKRNEDIIVYTNSFISLLQDTLRIDRNSIFVSLDQELKNVRNYITLQEMRYPGLLNTHYEIDEDVKQTKVPNVLIQPIVENSIFHGLAVRQQSGNLWITATKDADMLLISVRDDGVGMNPAKARELLKSNRGEQDGMRKIGIANVNERIQHIYGEQYGITIHTEQEKGTEVIIKFPMNVKK